MRDILYYFETFPDCLIELQTSPLWNIPMQLQKHIAGIIRTLGSEYHIKNEVAIHRTAQLEEGVIIKDPVIIEENCFIGAHAYLRGGVYLNSSVSIGPGCEIKSSVLGKHSSIAHFNFIGDSLLGEHVNFEAGAVTANHYNERKDKRIFVWVDSRPVNTNCEKFGSVIGDHSKIGANAVLSPGTLLPKNSVVKRLELVEQVKSNS